MISPTQHFNRFTLSSSYFSFFSSTFLKYESSTSINIRRTRFDHFISTVIQTASLTEYTNKTFVNSLKFTDNTQIVECLFNNINTPGNVINTICNISITRCMFNNISCSTGINLNTQNTINITVSISDTLVSSFIFNQGFLYTGFHEYKLDGVNFTKIESLDLGYGANPLFTLGGATGILSTIRLKNIQISNFDMNGASSIIDISTNFIISNMDNICIFNMSCPYNEYEGGDIQFFIFGESNHPTVNLNGIYFGFTSNLKYLNQNYHFYLSSAMETHISNCCFQRPEENIINGEGAIIHKENNVEEADCMNLNPKRIKYDVIAEKDFDIIVPWQMKKAFHLE